MCDIRTRRALGWNNFWISLANFYALWGFLQFQSFLLWCDWSVHLPNHVWWKASFDGGLIFTYNDIDITISLVGCLDATDKLFNALHSEHLYACVFRVIRCCVWCMISRGLRYFSFLIRSSVFWGALNGLACSSPVTIRAFSDRLFSSVFACSLSYVALLWFSSSPRCPLFLSVLFRTLFLLSSRLADTACTEGWSPSIHVHLLGLVLVKWNQLIIHID